MNWTKLALIFGVGYALMKIVFGVLLWVDPIGFMGNIFPIPDLVNYETLLRDRWVSNRQFPSGIALLVCIIFKKYRLASVVLFIEFGVQILDVLVLALCVWKNIIFSKTVFTLIGAIFLTLGCLLSGLRLIKTTPGK